MFAYINIMSVYRASTLIRTQQFSWIKHTFISRALHATKLCSFSIWNRKRKFGLHNKR